MSTSASLRRCYNSLLITLVLPVILLAGLPSIYGSSSPFQIRESSVHDMRLAFEQKKLTSRQLTTFYLGEIKRLNPVLKGVMEVNPDALAQADRADRERLAKSSSLSLPGLHGIPILLKDNIGTKDKLNTTAGSFALLGSIVRRDAGVVSKLRKAGAIIIGKASMSEWAAFRSLTAPSGWSARGGQAKVYIHI